MRVIFVICRRCTQGRALAVLLVGAYTLYYTLGQQRAGRRNIWTTSLVRYNPHAILAEKAAPVISTDYFASSPGNTYEGSFFTHQW